MSLENMIICQYAFILLYTCVYDTKKMWYNEVGYIS